MIAERSITLRPVTPEDTSLLLQIYGSTRAEELALTSWSEEQKTEFVRMQFLAQKSYYEANYPGAGFSVIEVDGEPAGRLYIHRTAEEIRVMDIAILPAFRRRGVGTSLLTDIQTQAAAERRKVGIHVEIFNPAIHLYERLGFKRLHERGVYYFLQWTPESTQLPPS